MANFVPGITKLPTIKPTPTTIFQGINGETIPYSPWNNVISGVPVTMNDVIASAKKEAPVNSDFTGYPRPAYTFGNPVDIDALSQEVIDRSGINGTKPIISPKYDMPAYAKAGSLLGLDELAKAIINNKYGVGLARKQKLLSEGYSPEQIDAAQKLVNKTMARPVRRAPVRRNVDAVIAPKANTTVVPASVAQEPVRQGYNSSGYTTGHEAYYDPVSGQLRYR